MTREEAITVFKAFMDNPLFSDVHKAAFNIAIHDIKQRHDWDINNLILINKDNYESQEPKAGHCKDCKWWRDSDGLYRRGSHAESQCPINRREVFEGNGYCYMFEPQERSDKE